ncbi:MAG: electron transport complex subunit RsxC [Lachnospiraceae bacterium]|nr:electron transport complex subunit RsxC [Lachnospiraceae bacterium]
MKKVTFRGGVHPSDQKQFSRDIPFSVYEPKGDMVYPLSQHIGAPASPVVKKGDEVLAGQIIAEAGGFVSANIISSCSGKVKSIEKRMTATGTKVQSIVIENDGEFRTVEGIGKEVDYKTLTKEEILAKIKDAGIVGLGGAGFPTHVKLAPKNADAIEYVIANGAECEPYITCDDQLMRGHAVEIVTGMEIFLKLFPRAEGVILIEENKPEAIAAMKKACEKSANVRVLPVQTKYPQGGERSIISVVAGKHLKLGMLPADLGCVVDNVATIYAVYNAVCKSTPLMIKGLTVSGDAVKNPGNFWVRIGTSFEELLEAAGGIKDGVELKKAICGGPMMGFAMANFDVPVQKSNNALTLLAVDAVEQAHTTACIRCGRCNMACSLGLVPQMMADAVERKDYERYENKLYGLECVACGSCTYVCPAKRPLMQMFKQTKAEIMAAKRAAQAAKK